MPYLSERNPPLVLSPDGALLATSNRDGAAVFDARTLHQRFVLPGQDDGVSALAFSPDGSRLAVGYTSGTSIVWQVAGSVRCGRSEDTARRWRTSCSPPMVVSSTPCRATGSSCPGTSQAQAPSLRRDSSPKTRAGRSQPCRRPTVAPWPMSSTGAGVSRTTSTKPGHIQFRDVATGRLTPPRRTVWGGPSTVEWEWSPDSRQFALSGGVVNVPRRAWSSTTSRSGIP